MTDLNKTIDRSMQISRGVASTFESRVHDAVQAFTKRVGAGDLRLARSERA
jgi:hypothetical protein